jgi:4-hydroxyphenylpyruvate dioxygenase
MSYRPAISSHSLGRAWVHNIHEKLDQAAKYGLHIELFYEDLHYVAKGLPGGATVDNEVEAAHIIRALCDERGLTIMCLQPFMHYEGIMDRRKHTERIQEMQHWIDMAKILGTNFMAIPSTCLTEADGYSGDMELIIRDFREIADLGAARGIQYAYESLCFGTYADTWEQSWEIVQRVDRPNFKICLDTFNMAGRMYADPASPTGRVPNAEEAVRQSLERLVNTVDVRKILYIQVVDAELLSQPLVEGHEFYDATQRPRMSWSRNCRLFYGEQDRGAYLPIKAILKAILVDLKFEGWISAELFNRSLADADPSVPKEHAERAAISWRKIVEDFGLEPAAEKFLGRNEKAEQQPARAQL